MKLYDWVTVSRFPLRFFFGTKIAAILFLAYVTFTILQADKLLYHFFELLFNAKTIPIVVANCNKKMKLERKRKGKLILEPLTRAKPIAIANKLKIQDSTLIKSV